MTDYVRVRDTSGHEVTIRADRVPEGVEVLDKPALGPDRLPRPPKYRLPLGTPLPGGKADRKRRTRRPASPTPDPATDPEPDPNGQPAGSAEGEN